MRKLYFLLFVNLPWLFQAQLYQSAADFIKLGTEDGYTLMDAYLGPVHEKRMFAVAEGLFQPFREKPYRWHLSIRSYWMFTPLRLRKVKVSSLKLKYMEAEDYRYQYMETAESIHHMSRFVSKLKDTLGNAAYVYEPGDPVIYRQAPYTYFQLTYTLFPWLNLTGGFSPFAATEKLDSTVAGQKPLFMWNVGFQADAGRLITLPEKWQWVIDFQYNSYHSEYKISVQPGINYINTLTTGSHQGPYDHQSIKLKLCTYSVINYAVYRISKISRLYAGLGYSRGTVQMRFKGTFPAYRPDPSGAFAVNLYDLHNPEPLQKTHYRFWGEAGVFLEGERFSFRSQISYGKYWGINMGIGYKFNIKIKNPDIK